METKLMLDGAQITYVAPPAQRETVFGLTPRSGFSVADVVQMDKDYSIASDVVRLFCPDQLVESGVSDRLTVVSFNSMTNFDLTVARLCWRLIYKHEVDHAWIESGTSVAVRAAFLAAWKKVMVALVQMGIPGLAICVTADVFMNQHKNPSDFLVPGVNIWYVDFDGISNTKLPYHSYTAVLTRARSFAVAHGLTLGVGEFGTDRAEDDPTGEARAYWLADGCMAFKAAFFEAVCLWEFHTQPGSLFTSPAEMAAVHTIMAIG